MAEIIVQGAQRLTGSVEVSGSKNACLPILCASLLNEQPVKLNRVPALRDVIVNCEVISSLGADMHARFDDHFVVVNSSSVNNTEPPYELVNKMRASFLVLGPLLARFGEASVPLPGGCAIGTRPVGEHLRAMELLGAEIRQEQGRIVARAKKLVGTDIYLNIDSVGATENAIMAATLAEGTTTIHNAALEPEVTDLCHFLERCGVEFEGIGSKSIVIHGQSRISAAVEYSVIPDRIEAGTYLMAIAASRGSGTVTGLRSDHLEAIVLKLREVGVQLEVSDTEISIQAEEPLEGVKIRTAIYPGFPTDLQPQTCVLLTQAAGVSTVDETIFEQRLSHIPELKRMGANAQISGKSAVINGVPGELTGVPVEAHDLRCAAALVIAGLIARGETHISGLKHLVRGYEDLPQKFAALGGDVRYSEEEASVEVPE